MTLAAPEIGTRYRAVRARAERACEAAGRAPAEVTVVAVSKAHSVASIEAAYEAGCEDFGENRVQEWADKAPRLPRRLRWHFIGHLQTNKVKYLADDVTLIHSVDRERLVDALEQRASSPHDVLIEINVGSEAAKSGAAAADFDSLLGRCARSSVVRPVGLMCIPPYHDDPEDSRPYYRRLAELRVRGRELLQAIDPMLAEDFVHLSMGMTHDFEVAISEGATLIRVGTAIFGSRT